MAVRRAPYREQLEASGSVSGSTQLAQTYRYRDSITILMAFRGIGLVSVMTLACELGDIRRYAHTRQLKSCLDLAPSEHSSGDRVTREDITETGNTHARKALVSAAWK